MRTKTLLLTAAAMAAGIASSLAGGSNVYSANIVGYVNKDSDLGYVATANPFNGNNGDNSAANVIDNSAGQWDGSLVYLWNGIGFDSLYLDSSSPTGYTDIGGNPVPAPTLAPGTGFLFNNQNGSNVVTYVGEVAGDITGDPTLTGSLTIPASPLNQFIASPLPIAGKIITDLQMPNDGSLDGDAIQVPNIVSGNLTSWSFYYFDSSSPTGITDVGGTPVAEPVIPIASAFLFVNSAATVVNWTQVINY